MKLLEFVMQFPDESSCIAKLKGTRDKQVKTGPLCGKHDFY